MPLIVLLAGCGGGPCGEEKACQVHSGAYHVFPPSGGADAALPVVMYWHGHGGSPAQYYENEDVLEAFSSRGVLLVLPVGQTVDPDYAKHSPEDRDEVDFAHEILDDVGARFSIDSARVSASGFSVGGSAAALVGCESTRFASIAPMSGGLWDPLPEECPGGPTPMFRVHGTADTTWPMEGRDFDWGAQSDVFEEVALWRVVNGADGTGEDSSDEVYACTTWSGDAEVRLCLHEQGHDRLDGWPDVLLDWVLAQP